MSEYQVLKPFTYLRSDGAVVRQTKTGGTVELDEKEAEQAGTAVEAVKEAPVPAAVVDPDPAASEPVEQPSEDKPKRRSHRHSGVSEPAQSGSEEAATPAAEPDGQ